MTDLNSAFSKTPLPLVAVLVTSKIFKLLLNVWKINAFFVIFDIFKIFLKIVYPEARFGKKYNDIGKPARATVLELGPNFK